MSGQSYLLFQTRKRTDLEEDGIEITWVELQLKPRPILVGIAYRPPNMLRNEAITYVQSLQENLMRAMNNPNTGIYLLDDFNDKCQKWESRHSDSELKQDLLETTTAIGLTQLIDEPTYTTRTSNNLLDLIFTNMPGQVITSGTLPPFGTSHHSVVHCTCNLLMPKPTSHKKEIWKYREGDIEGLNAAIGDFPFDDILPDDTDEAAEIWTHTLLTISKEYIPCHEITVHSRDKPWITHDIKKLIKKRNASYRKYQRTRETRHYDIYLCIKDEVNEKILEAKEEYRTQLVRKLEDLRTQPRDFWKVAKQVYGSKTHENVPTLIDNNTHYTKGTEKANLLASYFSSQSQEPVLPADHSFPEVEDTDHKLTEIIITEEDVNRELRKLKPGKSTGPDGLSNELLKLTSRSIAPSLTELYNRVLRSGVYPKLWKKANVTPVHKKNTKQDKKNYRPISLLCTVGKVLERLIFNQIYGFLEQHNLLTWRNSGYKRKDSTINRLIRIVNTIHLNLERKEKSCLVFLDQSKAFDRIHHASLLHKLKMKGIDGMLLDVLANYLQDRKIRVALEGAESRWYHIRAGVPQGSILGPLMFLIYADDIVEGLECDIHLYADDAVLITNYIAPEEAYAKLNRDLQRLESWATKWFMSFNPAKTKYMVIAGHDQPHPHLMFNDVILEEVSTYPQLGLVLNNRLTWEDHHQFCHPKIKQKNRFDMATEE